MSQKETEITYKIDFVANTNVMPFKIFKSLFPKSIAESLYVTINNSVI